jgi:hypothetical protein
MTQVSKNAQAAVGEGKMYAIQAYVVLVAVPNDALHTKVLNVTKVPRRNVTNAIHACKPDADNTHDNEGRGTSTFSCC